MNPQGIWRRLWSDRLFLCGVVIAALLLRLDFLLANNFIIDADEAIVGLMAKHIAEGEPIPTFYYGQHYMGSFEPLVTTVLFSIFGVSSAALKAVPLLFSLLLIPLLYLLAWELSGRTGARVTALLISIPPSTLVVWSAKARGGFIELLCIGALAMLLTCRWIKRDQAHLGLTSGIGLTLGFGWWVNNQIIYFVLPIGFVMLARLVAQERAILERLQDIFWHLLGGLVAFILGGFPFWLYNLQNEFVSFQMFGASGGSDFIEHLGGLFSTALPILFGAKRFWQTEDLFLGSSLIVGVLYISLLLYLVWHRAPRFRKLFAFQIDQDSSVELIVLFVFSTVAVFTLSSFGYLVQAPRYLLPLYVGVFVLLGWAIHQIWDTRRLLAVLLVGTMLSIHLLSSYSGGRAIPGEPFVFKSQRVSKDHAELIQWLSDYKYSWVRTNYWIGYRLAFETEEAVRFLIVQKPYQVRIEQYRELGERFGRERMPFVLVPAQAKIVEHALTVLGLQYERVELSGYVVIHKIEPLHANLERIDSRLFSVSASANDANAALATDNLLDTRWGSAAPQNPSMNFTIEFLEPQSLYGFRYDMGEWRHDYPRSLKVQVELSTGELMDIMAPSDYEAVRYLIEYGSTWEAYFHPLVVRKIILSQLGSHQLFDWTIAEIEPLTGSRSSVN